MLQGLRDQVITLSCLRHGLATHHGRGVDQLPKAALTALTNTWPTELTSEALATAYAAAVQLLGEEAELVDPDLAYRLRGPLAILQATTTSAVP